MSLKILYASQTGWTEELALRVKRTCWRYYIDVSFFGAMDEYDIRELINEKLIIFLCSTTGDGEEPDNMKTFWRFLLRKNLPNDLLNQLNFFIFGLGDSSYNKFNYTSKKLHRRLEQLGAKILGKRGEGDDQHYLGLEGAYIPWEKELINNLRTLFPEICHKQPKELNELPPPNFKFLSKEILTVDQNNSKLASKEGWNEFNVKVNKRITSEDHFQESRLLSFYIEDENNTVKWNPGDHIQLLPENLDEEVDSFLKLLGWEDSANKFYYLESTDQALSLPNHLKVFTKLYPQLTLKEWIKKAIDLRSSPRQQFFYYLHHFSTSPLELEKLFSFINTPEGIEDMIDYSIRPHRTLLETLTDFQSYQIPVEYLFDMFTTIKPRVFSIANMQSNHIDIAVGMIEYSTRMKVKRIGLATQYIRHNLNPGPSCKIHLKVTPGTFRLPASLDVPILMIAPGLGVAPFRSLIQHRVSEGATNNFLIFGGRNYDKDTYFEEEFEEYQRNGKLCYIKVHSRDQKSKIYVQDAIKQNGDLIAKIILENEANIYFCGRGKDVPNQIEESIKSVLIEYRRKHLEEGEENLSIWVQGYFKSLTQRGRFQKETWD